MRLVFLGDPGDQGARVRVAGDDRRLAALERLDRRLPAGRAASPLARFASSEPWQAKQFFDRIGRTSRLKSTGRGAAAGFVAGGSAAEARPWGQDGESPARAMQAA